MNFLSFLDTNKKRNFKFQFLLSSYIYIKDIIYTYISLRDITILNHLIQKSSKILKYKANLLTILHIWKYNYVVFHSFSAKGFNLIYLTLSKTLIIAREFSRRIATNSLTRCQRKRKLRHQVSRKSTLSNEASSNLGTQEDHTYDIR